MMTETSKLHRPQSVRPPSFKALYSRLLLPINIQRWFQAWTFRRALGRVYSDLAQDQPQWVDSFFDEYFVQRIAAPWLLRSIQDKTLPTPLEFANLWADQFTSDSSARRHVAQLVPIVAEFLNRLEVELENQSFFINSNR